MTRRPIVVRKRPNVQERMRQATKLGRWTTVSVWLRRERAEEALDVVEIAPDLVLAVAPQERFVKDRAKPERPL